MKNDYSLFEGKNLKDKMLLEVDSMIAYFLGISLKPLIDASIERINDKDVLVVIVEESHKPRFLLNRREGKIVKEMFTRMHASTHQLFDIEDIVDYIMNKNWKSPPSDGYIKN